MLEDFWNNVSAINAYDRNQKGKFRRLVKQMMTSVSFRYAAHHIVWQVKNGKLRAAFEFVPLWLFENRTGTLRYLKNPWAQEGEILADGEWMVSLQTASDEADTLGVARPQTPEARGHNPAVKTEEVENAMDSQALGEWLFEIRSALAADLQPLGDALAGALEAGDLAAMQAALKKISKGMPELAGDAANLSEVLAGQFAGAFPGDDAEEVANVFNPMQSRDLMGRWSGEGGGGGGRFSSKPAKDWKPDAGLPEITTEQARAILSEGRDVTDPLDNSVRFDRSLEAHWRDGSKESWDVSRRLGQLPEAMRTVEHPHEIWRDGESRIYLHRHGPKEGMTAFVEISDGKAATYHPAEHFAKLQSRLNKLARDPRNLLWSRFPKGGRD